MGARSSIPICAWKGFHRRTLWRGKHGMSQKVKSRRFKFPEETSVIFALLVLVGIVGALRPTFLKPENLLNLAASYSISALLAGCIVYLLSM
jgi:ribose transport system permease protein